MKYFLTIFFVMCFCFNLNSDENATDKIFQIKKIYLEPASISISSNSITWNYQGQNILLSHIFVDNQGIYTTITSIPNPSALMWSCPKCGTWNFDFEDKCTNCTFVKR